MTLATLVAVIIIAVNILSKTAGLQKLNINRDLSDDREIKGIYKPKISFRFSL